MNRQAQFDVARKTIYWMIAGFIIAMVVLAFAVTLGNYRSRLTEVPPKIRAELIALRFTNNPDCFAFVDEKTGVVSPGTIDPEKFTREQLDRCYRTEQEKGFKIFNFRLTLESTGEELLTNNYFHQDRDDLTIFKEVLVVKDQRFVKDRLIIYVQEKI